MYYTLSTSVCLQVLHDVLHVVLHNVLHLHCTVLKTTNIMANEIKFRWVGRNRKFGNIQINSELTTSKILYGDYLSFFFMANRDEQYGNCEFLSEDLFTGLQDKNGKEIYVGDIVCGFGGEKGYVVKFNNGSFEWKREPLGWDLDYIPTPEPYDTRKWAVVIGNIYENPELQNKNYVR